MNADEAAYFQHKTCAIFTITNITVRNAATSTYHCSYHCKMSLNMIIWHFKCVKNRIHKGRQKKKEKRRNSKLYSMWRDRTSSISSNAAVRQSVWTPDYLLHSNDGSRNAHATQAVSSQCYFSVCEADENIVENHQIFQSFGFRCLKKKQKKTNSNVKRECEQTHKCACFSTLIQFQRHWFTIKVRGWTSQMALISCFYLPQRPNHKDFSEH